MYYSGGEQIAYFLTWQTNVSQHIYLTYLRTESLFSGRKYLFHLLSKLLRENIQYTKQFSIKSGPNKKDE